MWVWRYNSRHSCLIRFLSRKQTLSPLHRRADWFQRHFGLFRRTQITFYLLELEPRFFGRCSDWAIAIYQLYVGLVKVTFSTAVFYKLTIDLTIAANSL
jgi:hypothetical protein